jgi:putative flavoprotein involved in K+ transport
MNAHVYTDAVAAWLAQFGRSLSSGDAAAVSGLFAAQCYWRDLVSFTWNIKTMEGRDEIVAMLRSQLETIKPGKFAVEGSAGMAGDTIESWFTFETAQARGKGHLRLKDGKCLTLLTTMTELIGHEEKSGAHRDPGIVHRAMHERRTWLEERQREERELGSSRQPWCLIIGGGQGGIALGARLRQLGVPTLIVEKNARPGDSWRNRYRTLVLHDPVWYDHLPYIPFPENWPVFTPKDKMGDWLEMYAKVMELNYWGSTECLSARYDPAAQKWSVTVRREGREIVLEPTQLVFATGSYGPPNEIEVKGAHRFRGEQYHSARHQSAERFRGKKAVVVGANSSAHDLVADLWENGAAEITMIQRSPTTVVRSETLMEIAFAPIYSQEAVDSGITTGMADLLFASLPYRLLADQQREVYEAIAQRDADLIARLNAVGFRTDYGEDGAGLMMKALRSGSGYYIDVGASELIANGSVKVKGGEIAELTESAVVMHDGSAIEADVIIYATGYKPMNEWVARIVSRQAADLIGPNWGYGSGMKGDPGPWQGELRNMWKPLRHENLWFHGGNLALSRHYSLYVALQLKARLEEIPTPVYG